MALDIQAKITELVKKISGSSDLLAKFKKDPINTVKDLIGNLDISSDTINTIVEGVKAKLNVDDAKGFLAKLKKLFKIG